MSSGTTFSEAIDIGSPPITGHPRRCQGLDVCAVIFVDRQNFCKSFLSCWHYITQWLHPGYILAFFVLKIVKIFFYFKSICYYVY